MSRASTAWGSAPLDIGLFLHSGTDKEKKYPPEPYRLGFFQCDILMSVYTFTKYTFGATFLAFFELVGVYCRQYSEKGARAPAAPRPSSALRVVLRSAGGPSSPRTVSPSGGPLSVRAGGFRRESRPLRFRNPPFRLRAVGGGFARAVCTGDSIGGPANCAGGTLIIYTEIFSEIFSEGLRP